MAPVGFSERKLVISMVPASVVIGLLLCFGASNPLGSCTLNFPSGEEKSEALAVGAGGVVGVGVGVAGAGLEGAGVDEVFDAAGGVAGGVSFFLHPTATNVQTIDNDKTEIKILDFMESPVC